MKKTVLYVGLGLYLRVANEDGGVSVTVGRVGDLHDEDFVDGEEVK